MDFSKLIEVIWAIKKHNYWFGSHEQIIITLAISISLVVLYFVFFSKEKRKIQIYALLLFTPFFINIMISDSTEYPYKQFVKDLNKISMSEEQKEEFKTLFLNQEQIGNKQATYNYFCSLAVKQFAFNNSKESNLLPFLNACYDFESA